MSNLKVVPPETIEQSLERLTAGVDRLIEEREMLVIVVRAFVAELPESWGDLVQGGYVRLNASEETVDAAFQVLMAVAFMSPIMVSAGESRTFTPAPVGLHQAVAVDVVDMGLLEVTYSGKTKKQWKVRVVWQIDEEMEDGRPFIVQKRYTASLNEKATLRKELESWRGRPFTQEELDAFDLDKLIGANCQLNIQHVTKDGKLYANVVSIVPLGKNMPKMVAKDYIRVQDRPAGEQEPSDHEGLTAEEIFTPF